MSNSYKSQIEFTEASFHFSHYISSLDTIHSDYLISISTPDKTITSFNQLVYVDKKVQGELFYGELDFKTPNIPTKIKEDIILAFGKYFRD